MEIDFLQSKVKEQQLTWQGVVSKYKEAAVRWQQVNHGLHLLKGELDSIRRYDISTEEQMLQISFVRTLADPAKKHLEKMKELLDSIGPRDLHVYQPTIQRFVFVANSKRHLTC